MRSIIDLYRVKSVECEASAAATRDPLRRARYERLAQRWRELKADEYRKEISRQHELYRLMSVEYEALAAATRDPFMSVRYQELAQQWRQLGARVISAAASKQ